MKINTQIANPDPDGDEHLPRHSVVKTPPMITNRSSLVETKLTPSQIKDAEAALSLAPSFSLQQAVSFALQSGWGVQSVTLEQAVSEFLQSKHRFSPLYQRALKRDVTEFAKPMLTTPINQGRVGDINDYLLAQGRYVGSHGPWSPSRQVQASRHVSSLYIWAMGKGYCHQNPTAKLNLPKVVPRPPLILDLAQNQENLDAGWCYQDAKFAAYPLLRTWGSLRPHEMERLTLDCLDLNAGRVRVQDGRYLRFVELAPCVILQLKELQKRGVLTNRSFNPGQYHLNKMFSLIGNSNGNATLHLKPCDRLQAMRQTGLAYYLAFTGNPVRTASWGGYSLQMLCRYHRNLISQADATAFWSMMPSKLGGQSAPPPDWK